MANPKVRPHLSFYPEEATKNLSEARHFARWLNEMPDDEMTPMLRLGKHDYYIYEPAMLRSGLICMPHRWFLHNGCHHARCWKMEQVVCEGNRKSWRVIKGQAPFNVDQDQFLKNFPQLTCDVASYPHLADVSSIEGKKCFTEFNCNVTLIIS